MTAGPGGGASPSSKARAREGESKLSSAPARSGVQRVSAAGTSWSRLRAEEFSTTTKPVSGSWKMRCRSGAYSTGRRRSAGSPSTCRCRRSRSVRHQTSSYNAHAWFLRFDAKCRKSVSSGLSSATCSCPATGMCRHILLAVLALRADAPSDAGTEDVEIISARDTLATMTEAELQKFAGADWDKAITQASISGDATVSEDGANLSVQLPDTDAPVVFLAGLGPKGAVFKGPKTTKRRVVTAAALVVRQQGGTQSLDQLTRAAPEIETLSADFLTRIKAAIEASVGTVFSGGSVIAEEHLFDLSISARAQAAPSGLLASR